MHSHLRLNSFLTALQETIAPEAASLTSGARTEGVGQINEQIEDKSHHAPATAFKVKLFLTLLQIASLIRYGMPFQRLKRGRRIKLLSKFRDSKIPLLRKGFWGVSTLLKLSVYGQAEVQSRIRYQPRKYR